MRLLRRHRAARLALMLAAGIALPGVSRAETLAMDPAVVGDRSALSTRFGLEQGRAGLFSLDAEERNRAVDRLVTLGTPEAFGALFESLEIGSPIVRDPAGRLRLVRGLATSVQRDEVRAHLAKEMLDVGGRRDVGSQLTTLTRETAALALARSGDAASLRLLVSAAMLRGPGGDPARLALLAYPPRRADALLFEEGDLDTAPPAVVVAVGPKGKPNPKSPTPAEPEVLPEEEGPPPVRALNPSYLAFLGELGEVRAIGPIRAELDRSDRAMRAAAALALAKLGDGHAAPIVRAWDTKGDPRVTLAAAEALALLGDAEAPRFLAAALASPDGRGGALVLATDHPSAELCKPLTELKDLSPRDAVRRVMALAASNCVEPLLGSIEDPTLGPAVMTALARSPSARAAEAIEAGVEAARARAQLTALDRQWVRAALARAIARGRVSSELEDVLRRAFDAKADADVELGALGLVALRIEPAAELLAKRKDDAALFGIARGALVGTPADREALAAEFALVDPEALGPRALAAGVSLLEGGATIPKKVLLRLAEKGGALASLASSALGRRAGEADRDRLVALLSAGDASVRLGAALGLGDAPVPAATSWLVNAYATEEDAAVRRAIVASLARRTEVQRERTLATAAAFDPDPQVRSLAQGGSPSRLVESQRPAGNLLEFAGIEAGLFVLTLVTSSDTEGARATPVTLTLPSGLVIPAVTSADGTLFVPGAPFGRSTVRLASVRDSNDPP